MRKLAIVAFAAAIAIPSAVRAEINPFGVGAMGCGEYLEEAEKTPGMHMATFGWVQGFMAGLNVPHVAEGTAIEISTEPSAMRVQMMTFRLLCAEHPNSTVGRAAVALYKALREERGAAEAKPAKGKRRT